MKLKEPEVNISLDNQLGELAYNAGVKVVLKNNPELTAPQWKTLPKKTKKIYIAAGKAVWDFAEKTNLGR
jgi:hypothetical protein